MRRRCYSRILVRFWIVAAPGTMLITLGESDTADVVGGRELPAAFKAAIADRA